MAILKNGANGGFSGKVGSIVGYELSGQDVIRGLPKKRTKKAGQTEQLNRNKFALTQHWLQPLLAILRIGFKAYAPTYQGFVAAKSYNSKHALKEKEDGIAYVDPALALLSFGALTLPQSISMERHGDEIVVNWSKDGHYQGIDLAMLVAYIPETGATSIDTAAAKRYVGTATLPMPANPNGHAVHVYIAFVAFDHSSQSNSYYLGTINDLPDEKELADESIAIEIAEAAEITLGENRYLEDRKALLNRGAIKAALSPLRDRYKIGTSSVEMIAVLIYLIRGKKYALADLRKY